MSRQLLNPNPGDRNSFHCESAGPGRCWWCGQQRRRVFAYYYETPLMGSQINTEGVFCNLDCFRSYGS